MKRVAVIAVHGVAYHPPNASVRQVTELLINADRSEQVLRGGSAAAARRRATYTPFREISLDIAVRHLDYQERREEESANKQRTRGPRMEKRLKGQPSTNQLDHDFMCDLLDGYTASDAEAVYETLRLEGSRLDPEGVPDTRVHVYEMYWNDLSKVGGGIAGFFSTLYLLIFHIGDLGAVTVDAARSQNHESLSPVSRAAWRLFSALHWMAVRLLTIPIPLLNLLALAVGMGLLLCSVHDQESTAAGIAAAAVPAVAAFAAVGLAGWKWYGGHPSSRGPVWLRVMVFVFILAGLVAAGIWHLVSGQIGVPYVRTLLLQAEWLVIASALFALILQKYRAYRPEAGLPGLILGGLTLMGTLAALRLCFRTDNRSSQFVATALFEVIRWLYAVLFACWTAFVAATVLTVVVGLLTVGFASRNDPAAPLPAAEYRRRNGRCWWTSVISLTIPALLFLGVTLTLWGAVRQTTSGVLRQYDAFPPAATQALWLPPEKPNRLSALRFPIWVALGTDAERSSTKTEKVDAINGDVFVCKLLEQTIPGLTVEASLVGGALIIIAWAFTPSVLMEASPPRGAAVKRRSAQLGRWLTDGYLLMGLAGFMLLFTLCVYLPATYFSAPSSGVGAIAITPTSAQGSPTFVGTAAVPVAATTVLAALGALLTQLRGATGKFGALVGVLLDVDNHLRRLPRRRTPRARMCARYASLLRYISRWRDADSDGNDAPGYDAIVLVAHSQGTVLTADLLRFLESERRTPVVGRPSFQAIEPALADLGQGRGIPLYLLTMGCPLRQLYALRFPYLYAWARVDTDNTHDVSNPTDLGVTEWINLYRSGDYVGRHLWSQDDAPAVWDYGEHLLPSDSPGQNRCEVCIGSGAHTHYWDDTAPQVARALDDVIGKVTSGPGMD